ncbi:MAG: PIN domain-containing protein [Phycisphaerales bacterium]
MNFMIAVDTNILVYAFDATDDARKHRARAVLDQQSSLAIPWQVANEFIAVATRRGLAAASAWALLDSFVSRNQLLLPSSSTHDLAKDLHINHQVAFWDALLYASCIEHHVSLLLSEDVPGKAIPNLNISNPFAQRQGNDGT